LFRFFRDLELLKDILYFEKGMLCPATKFRKKTSHNFLFFWQCFLSLKDFLTLFLVLDFQDCSDKSPEVCSVPIIVSKA
jgi:hypothetical protein